MTSESVPFAAVSDALWRQRDLLQALAERLALAGADVRPAIEEMQAGEVLRAAEAEELARSLGLPEDASLAALAAAALEPWRTLLLDHREGLLRLYTQITALAIATGRRIWQQSLDDFLA